MSLPNALHLKLFSLIASFFLLPGLLHAEEEERWYQVEVILFSQNSSDYHDSEMWPLDFTLPPIEQSQELIKPDERAAQAAALLPEPFTLIGKDRLQLTNTAQRIKRASDVNLVLHLGWLQPGLAEDQAVAVHIYDGMLDKPTRTNTQERPIAQDPLGLTMQEELPKLDGTLRLILSRYLHLESDLVWREPLPPSLYGLPVYDRLVESESESGAHQLPTSDVDLEPSAAKETPLADAAATADTMNYQVFRLQQSRRMRSDEVHYIDHPLFGIIAKVTRYEPPQPEQDTGTVEVQQP